MSGIVSWASVALFLVLTLGFPGPALTQNPPGSLTVIAPNGGEIWAPGSSQTITWAFTGDIGAFVGIELLSNGSLVGPLASTAPAGTVGTGSFTWQIPQSHASGTGYQVRVTSNASPTISDFSDAFFSILGPPGTILTAPNGGESWVPGSAHLIQWVHDGGPVRIDLYQGGSLYAPLASTWPTGAGGQGAFGWTIPDPHEQGTDFRIVVTSTANPALTDASDGDFAIVYPPRAISILTPNGGEAWNRGVFKTVTWSYAGFRLPDDVRLQLDLLKGGSFVETLFPEASLSAILPRMSSGLGRFFVFIPSDTLPGNDYRIQATTVFSGPTVTDTSDGDFSLTGNLPQPESVTFLSPTAGDVWHPGETHTISWNYTGDEASMGLSGACGGVDVTVPTGSPDPGSYTWTVPLTLLGHCNFTASRGFTDIGSSDLFAINGPLPEVTTPNGGERWFPGTVQAIQWKSFGGDSVRVELLKGAALHGTISSLAETGGDGFGSLDWAIPDSQYPGSDYRIRVVFSSFLGDLPDVSDAPFTLASSDLVSNLMLTTPIGGEVWMPGTTQTINWAFTGFPNAVVRLELWKGGALYGIIASSVPIGTGNTGSFDWMIPPGQLPGMDYRVRISSPSATVESTSVTDFSIQATGPGITGLALVYPVGGEVLHFEPFSSVPVTWTYAGDGTKNVRIEVLRGGVFFGILSSAFPVGSEGIGTFYWLIPSNHIVGYDYRVRISSVDDPAVSGTSLDDFAIVPPP